MLTSKALVLGSIIFALFSIYALFYSLYMTQLKFGDTSDINLLSQDNSTWFQPKVKVVMVVIDGLRFDYLLDYKNIDNDEALQVNKFKGFNQAFYDEPEKFVVVRAQADLPTMTVLRVPCLMTGNVPRLGSVLTAFGALPATEDSIPRQLHKQGKKKNYFTGDPILKQYFPDYLISDFEIGAFSISDREVDEPSHDFINKKIAENDFDFLAAHLLRLDHMGHNTNLYNPEVLAAIEDIDQFLLHIMSTIDDNTMLIFGGDHGMTKNGDHGDASSQETNTAIVAYYKKGFMKYKKHKNDQITRVMRSVNETNAQVPQIDLAPSLAMLMGLPTPFSNMGQILNDLYPKGDYLSQQACPDAAFEMQMLHDNHLNTLQIWNYFNKYHNGQSLFNQQEYSTIANSYNELDAAYKAADKMIQENRQCEDSFHEVAVDAILKSQQLSKQIHDLVSTKPPHDLVVFWQGFILLVLVALFYVFIVQYLYKTKDYEYISWNSIKPKNWKAVAKSITPITLLLALIWSLMLAHDYIIMRPITTSVLIIAAWIFGSLVLSFLAKPQEYLPDTLPSTNVTEERQASSLSLKSLFLVQNPLVSAGAVAIIACLFYLTHVFQLNKFWIADKRANNPYIFVVIVGARVAGRYLKISPYIMAASLLIAKIVNITDIDFLWSSKGMLIMGLSMIADWLWGEIQFTRSKLKAGKIWSFHYAICFTALILYHLVIDPETEFVKIILPRVIWAILIGSILASFALKMPRQTIKRNMQINLVLFLTLMQIHRKVINFGFVLSLMRIVTFLFKRAQFKNYLYALFIGFISFVGLYSIGFSDRKLPRSFGPAFVGLNDFHLGLCLFLYSSAMLSTIILGMLFISFYDQDLQTQEVDLGTPKEQSSSEVVALKGYSEIIKKRNIIFFSFFYCLVFIGAAISPVVSKSNFRIYLSMERFLVDGAFYFFTINILYFML